VLVRRQANRTPGRTAPRADLTKRIAGPMVGGIFTSFLMELLVYPAIYSIWRAGGRRAFVPEPFRQLAWVGVRRT
jgi:hypothetical protein